MKRGGEAIPPPPQGRSQPLLNKMVVMRATPIKGVGITPFACAQPPLIVV